MTGFGIRLQPEIRRQVGERRMWRPHSFLHQLSRSGSMLWVANHDRDWLRFLGTALGEPQATWPELRLRLAAWPAGRARRALYAASVAWLEETERLRPRIEAWILETGMDAPASLSALDDELEMRREQVERLAWCADDATAGERIEIIR